MTFKRIVVAVVVCAVLATTLFAGGRPETPGATPDGPVRIVIWGAVPAENGPQQVVDNFNAAHPHIRAEYVRYVNNPEGNARLDTALLAGERIDAFISYSPAALARRIEGGFAADMSGLLADAGIDPIAYFGAAAQPFIGADGSIFAIPTIKWMNLIFANRDALEAIGVQLPILPGQLTWQQYRDIARRLTADNRVELGHFITPSEFMIEEYFRTATGRRNVWIDETGRTSTWRSNPRNAEALRFFHDLMHADRSMVSWERVISDGLVNQEGPVLYNGIAGMVMTGTHQMRNVNSPSDFPRDFQVTFLPAPTPDASAPYYAPLLPNDLLSVNARSNHKAEVITFLNWYVTEGFDPMIPGGRLPLYQNYPADRVTRLLDTGATLADGRPLFDAEAFAAIVLGEAPRTIFDGPDTGVVEIAALMREQFESYFLRLQTLDATLTALDRGTQQILDEKNRN